MGILLNAVVEHFSLFGMIRGVLSCPLDEVEKVLRPICHMTFVFYCTKRLKVILTISHEIMKLLYYRFLEYATKQVKKFTLVNVIITIN